MNTFLIIKYLLNVILSKKSYILGSAIASSLITFITNQSSVFEKICLHIEDREGTVPLITFFILLLLSYLFIFIDFITGVVASKRGGNKIESKKWAATINKFFGLFLYSCLAAVIILLLTKNYFMLILLYTPIILTILKEFVSIGENLEVIGGKKSYMFTIIDKIFDILEMRFFKTLKEKEINTFSKGKSSSKEKDNHPELGK